MNCDIFKYNNLMVVRPESDFSINHSHEFSELEAILNFGEKFIVFDFANCNFIGSFGIRCLIYSGMKSINYGYKTVVIHASEKIAFMIERFEILDLVAFQEDLQGAEKYFTCSKTSRFAFKNVPTS